MFNKIKNFFKRSAEQKKIYIKKSINHRFLEAAKNNRLTADWSPNLTHIDNIIKANQRIITARARQQYLNNDYAKAFVKICSHNIIGSSGFILHAKNKTSSGVYNKLINQAIEGAWNNWAADKNKCDATEQNNFLQIQYNAIANAAIDGEFFYKIVKGDGDYGFSLKEIDSQFCDCRYELNKIKDGTYIKNGIEFNNKDQAINYYFNQRNFFNETYSETQSKIIIKKADILHGFIKELSGQKRGLSWLNPALLRLKQLGEFEDAALNNVRTSANNSGFLEWDEGHGPSEYNPDEEEVYIKSEPGTYTELPPGLRAKDKNKQYPAGEFALFHKSILRGISSGLGVSYNILANDLEGVNYSSLRSGALAEREEYLTKQEWFINCFLNPLFNEWLKYSLLAGQIKVNGRALLPENIERYNKIEWQGRRWRWVDPLKDVNAAIQAKNNLITTPSQIIKEQGKEPRDLWLNYAKDIEEMKAAGLPDEFINNSFGIVTQQQQQQAD